jgi:hypothetical protein
MDLHHPVFQSLVLPFLLAFVTAGALRRWLAPVDGKRWGAAATAFAILAVSIWILGLRAHPGATLEKLPWVYAAAGLLGLVLQAMRAGPRTAWVAACVLWVLMLTDLGVRSTAEGVAYWLSGTAVMGALLSEPEEGAGRPAALFIASLGLAMVAMVSGSALLFELGLALGFAVAGCALWIWPVARIAFGPCGAVAATMAWLALAQSTVTLTQVRPAVLLVLCGAFLAGPIVRWGGRGFRRGASAGAGTPARSWIRPLVVAAVAAVWAVGAFSLAVLGGGETPADAADDPYYTPRW